MKDKEQDPTREPEMVRAYRDTWQLGIRSYLSYLRDRLMNWLKHRVSTSFVSCL